MHTTELFQCAIFIMLSQSDLNQTFHLILYFDGCATTIKLKELVDCLIKSNRLNVQSYFYIPHCINLCEGM